jgi:hypothetical protein
MKQTPFFLIRAASRRRCFDLGHPARDARDGEKSLAPLDSDQESAPEICFDIIVVVRRHEW